MEDNFQKLSRFVKACCCLPKENPGGCSVASAFKSGAGFKAILKCIGAECGLNSRCDITWR